MLDSFIKIIGGGIIIGNMIRKYNLLITLSIGLKKNLLLYQLKILYS